MVGRHTTTGEFNPTIPNYRSLVNDLMTPRRRTPLLDLFVQPPHGLAPSEITIFFSRFSEYWNELVRQAAFFLCEDTEAPRVDLPWWLQGLRPRLERYRRDSVDRDAIEMTLARFLRRLEYMGSGGLGVGHSLIAVVYVDARER